MLGLDLDHASMEVLVQALGGGDTTTSGYSWCKSQEISFQSYGFMVSAGIVRFGISQIWYICI